MPNSSSNSNMDTAVAEFASATGEKINELKQNDQAIINFIQKLESADLAQLVSLTVIAGVGKIYCSVEDMHARFGDDLIVLTDRDKSGELDVRNTLIALVDATNECNLYLGRRYQLPPNPIPPALSRMTSDIAMYRLSTHSAVTEDTRKRYEDTIKQLRDIADGKVSLGIAEIGKADDEAGYANEVELEANPRLFSRRQSKPVF